MFFGEISCGIPMVLMFDGCLRYNPLYICVYIYIFLAVEVIVGKNHGEFSSSWDMELHLQHPFLSCTPGVRWRSCRYKDDWLDWLVVWNIIFQHIGNSNPN